MVLWRCVVGAGHTEDPVPRRRPRVRHCKCATQHKFNHIDSAIVWGVGSGGLRLPIPSTSPDGFRLLLQQCWNTTPRNRPTFRQILIHLDILSEDAHFGVLSEEVYCVHQQSWRDEVESTFRSMKQENDEDRAMYSTELRREEFSHIDDIRLHYERNLEECRQQRHQLEEMAAALRQKCVIQSISLLISRLLTPREAELAMKEEKLRLASSPRKLVVKENLQSRAKVIEELFERKRKISEPTVEADGLPRSMHWL